MTPDPVIPVVLRYPRLDSMHPPRTCDAGQITAIRSETVAQYAESRMLNGYAENSSLASYGPAILRLVLATVFIAHGAQKLFAIWGGGGLTGTSDYFSQLGLDPAYPLAVVAGVLEFGGGLLLLLGAYTSVASGLLILEMVVPGGARIGPGAMALTRM